MACRTASDPVYLNGELPVAPSAVAAKGHEFSASDERFEVPRALTWMKSSYYWRLIVKVLKTRKSRGLTVSKSMVPMVICSINFCKARQNRTDAYGGSGKPRASDAGSGCGYFCLGPVVLVCTWLHAVILIRWVTAIRRRPLVVSQRAG